MPDAKKTIGFIGLGAMGSSLAGRLLASGFTVGVFNRTPEKIKPLVEKGAWAAKTPKELAQKTDVIITCVTDDDALRSVLDGENGALAGAGKHSVFIDMSTVSVTVTRELAEKAASLGARFLDAPVLGSPSMAEEGRMPFVVGGSKETLEDTKGILECLGKNIVYMGESGLGQASKMVHSLVCGVSLVAYSEAILLGEKMGLKRSQTLSVLQQGAVACPLLTLKAEKFRENRFTPTNARLANMCKDLALAANEGATFHQDLPTLSAAKKLYDQAAQAGLADCDTSSVIKIL